VGPGPGYCRQASRCWSAEESPSTV
jgi:hypothetical protein